MMMLSDPNHRYNIIWEKSGVTGHLNASEQPLRCHEDIMVFYKELGTYNPQLTTGHKPVNAYTKHKDSSTNYNTTKQGISGGGNTTRYPRSVWYFPKDTQKSCKHPTQKPLALIKNIVLTYSNAGDMVLDNVAGSFTTGVACAETDRDFILIENNPKFFLEGKDRLFTHNINFIQYKDGFKPTN